MTDAERETKTAISWHRPRILVVEDNADLRELLANYLREEGFEVDAVSSAELGLERLQTERYAAALTDYTLKGGQTGLWLIAQASAARLLHPTNFVLLTGRSHLQATEGVRILQKPYDLVSLRLEIEAACDSATARS